MKTKLIAVLLIVSILLMAAGEVIKLMRLEVVNKSDQKAYLTVDMLALESEYHNYMVIEPGDEDLPNIQYFTLPRGVYRGALNYCENEETTYFDFDFTKAKARLVLLPCNASAQNGPGGDGVIKIYPDLYEEGNVIPYPIGEFAFAFKY